MAHSLLLLSVLASLLALGCPKEYCQKDGCPSESELPAGGGGGGQDTSMQSSSTFWDAMASVKDTVMLAYKKTVQGVYNKTAERYAEVVDNLVDDISENVRRVFQEEFNTYLTHAWESVIGTTPDNDSTVLWKVRKAAKIWMLMAGIIIFCLILHYLLWKISNNIFTAVINAVTLQTTVAVVYKLLGPELLYWGFFRVALCAWYTLDFVWAYLYISTGIVSLLCVGGNIYQWRRRVQKKEWMSNMIRNMDRRLQVMEEQNKNMGKQLNKIVEQNERLQSQLAQPSASH